MSKNLKNLNVNRIRCLWLREAVTMAKLRADAELGEKAHVERAAQWSDAER